MFVGLTEKQEQDIINEENPYENGYIGDGEIKIKVIRSSNGTIVAILASPLSFHAGQ